MNNELYRKPKEKITTGQEILDLILKDAKYGLQEFPIAFLKGMKPSFESKEPMWLKNRSMSRPYQRPLSGRSGRTRHQLGRYPFQAERGSRDRVAPD